METRRNEITYIRKRIVRVIVRYQNGGISTGTGSFISNEGDVLTCFHVMFGGELKNVRSNQVYTATLGGDEHTKLQSYFNQMVTVIEVEFPDGTRKKANLKDFNELYDVASIKLEGDTKTSFFKIDTEYLPQYDESAFFCGFQMAPGYLNPEQYPFATNRAVVSSFPAVVVGGDKYTHIQLNSINLGGNSGAPLFIEGGKKVIGIVNGNMNWGGDNLAFINIISGAPNFTQGPLRVPLSIAFATPAKLIKEKTTILE